MLKTKRTIIQNPWMVMTGRSVIATFFPPNDGNTLKSHLLIEDIQGRTAKTDENGRYYDSHDSVTLLSWLDYDPAKISFSRKSDKPFYTIHNGGCCEVSIAGRHYCSVSRGLAGSLSPMEIDNIVNNREI